MKPTRSSRSADYLQAAQVLAEAREELTRADGKASLLLAAAGVVFGAVSAAMLAGSWDPADLPKLALHVWWGGATVAAIGVVALGYAVYPRTRRRGKRQAPILGYFGDVAELSPPQLLELIKESEDSPEARLVDQCIQISRIVVRKYKGVRVGLWALAIGAVACSGAVFIPV